MAGSAEDVFKVVRARLDRAAEHLAAMDDECRAYARSSPCVIQLEDETGLRLVRDLIRSLPTEPEERFAAKQALFSSADWRHSGMPIVVSEVRPPSEHISLVFSDLVNNVRAALNNLATILVERFAVDGRPVVTNQARRKDGIAPGQPLTDFPLFDAPPSFEGSPRPLLWPETTPGIERVLLGLQPFNSLAQRGQVARMIREHSDADKHRELKLAVAREDGPGAYRVTFSMGQIVGHRWSRIAQMMDGKWQERPLEPGTRLGAILYREVLDGLDSSLFEEDVKVDGEVALKVTLDEPRSQDDRSRPLSEVGEDTIRFAREDALAAIEAVL